MVWRKKQQINLNKHKLIFLYQLVLYEMQEIKVKKKKQFKLLLFYGKVLAFKSFAEIEIRISIFPIFVANKWSMFH